MSSRIPTSTAKFEFTMQGADFDSMPAAGTEKRANWENEISTEIAKGFGGENNQDAVWVKSITFSKGSIEVAADLGMLDGVELDASLADQVVANIGKNPLLLADLTEMMGGGDGATSSALPSFALLSVEGDFSGEVPTTTTAAPDFTIQTTATDMMLVIIVGAVLAVFNGATCWWCRRRRMAEDMIHYIT